MPKIRCQAETCAHNSSGVCYANGINVAGGTAREKCETCCSSFLDRAVYSSLTNNTTTGDDCDRIACEVTSCVYQQDGRCSAETIEVSGRGANGYVETQCDTFRSR
ncbi:MAG: DUF1540 domain-containing protein [Selenomonadales bacterium]|nr:DUF1540 domain-containing protein [Selenomonadales bacterium]